MGELEGEYVLASVSNESRKTGAALVQELAVPGKPPAFGQLTPSPTRRMTRVVGKKLLLTEEQEVAPGLFENVPVGQGVQLRAEDWPGPAKLAVPAGQITGAWPAGQ